MFFNIIINFIFRLVIRFKKKIIIKKLSKKNFQKIYNGEYKNVYFSTKGFYRGDLPSQLLGIYEEQITKKILEIDKINKNKYLINFGSGDGYHVLGLIKKNIFKKAFCFEINTKTRKRLLSNIKKNNLSSKINVFGKASFDDVMNLISFKDLKKSLFLVDIEGEEFNLFTKKNLNFFKNSHLIIENHEKMMKNKKKLVTKFFKIMRQNFNSEIINHSSKNPFEIKTIKNFSEDLKWLSMSESRPFNQNWLIFYPKKN